MPAPASVVCVLIFRKAARRLAALCLNIPELAAAISTRIILGAVYFLVLTPTALFFRLLHGGAFNTKPGPAATYFEEKKHLFAPADFEEPW